MNCRPGKNATFPSNLFNTWLDYRESQGFSRADIIREVNQKLQKSYYNERFYKWKKELATVPKQVITEFIEPELPHVLEWFFECKGYPMQGVNFKALARLIINPDMAKFFKWYFENKGYSIKRIDFETLAEAFKPAEKKGDT